MMKLPHRRQFLHLAAGAAALPAVSRMASAQAYPSRPVRIIVVFPSGGVASIVARLMGQWLSEHLGQPFVIENRPGAGGNLGTEAALRAPADGYTLLLVGTNNFINATLYDNLKFNFIHDIAPIANIIQTPGVMEVNPSVPAKTVPEFIAYAKANPGKINMASAGNGTNSHVYGELFKTMTGLDMAPRTLSRLAAGPDRSDRWAGTSHVRQRSVVNRAYWNWTTSSSSGHDFDTFGRLAGASDCRRIRAGLCRGCLQRIRRPEGHAYRHYRQARQADRRGS